MDLNKENKNSNKLKKTWFNSIQNKLFLLVHFFPSMDFYIWMSRPEIHRKFTEGLKDFFKNLSFSPPFCLCSHSPPSPISSTNKKLLIEHPALSFKLQGAYSVHLKGGRSWRYQEASENVLYTARGYKDAGCPKNNNKEVFDRFTAFCISTDALQLKLAPQIIFRLNTFRTLWRVGKKGG